ncbi:MAG: transglycosylase SLT domain-containing protein [Burkholderiales bacterium]|nr:transglycosylase SLT domain-containing protein [Burkholderiales bacterium]
MLALAGCIITPAVAARSGVADASPSPRELVETAIRYEHAEGLIRDYPRAHALYCQAARQDSVDAFLRLGWMYANGRGLPRDDAIASTLFRRAAALGSDMGARLGQLIRGDADKLPACLQETPIVAEAAAPVELPAEPPAAAPPPVVIDYGPTPTIEAPAEFRPAPPSIDRRKLVQTVVQMAREFRLDPRLVFAVMQTESNFNPQARSVKNAQGLMQLIPETAERFAVRDAFDPIENLRGGMSYLRWLLSYFRGDVVLTLAGYNAGEGAVDKHRGVPPFAETLAYVQRIRALYPHDRHAFDTRVAAPSWIVNRTPSERPQARQGRAERAG